MSTESAVQTVEIKRFQCRHIFTDGHRCGSPCLRKENFCYFHHATRKVVSDPHHRILRKTHIELPVPEDRAALLLAIGEVLQCIATKAIDRKDAGLLLYGLQIANSALPREPHTGPGPVRANSRTHPRRSTREHPAEGDLEKLPPVEELVDDLHLGIMALPVEYLEPEEKEERRSLARRLLDEVEEYEARQEELQRFEAHREQIAVAVRHARSEAREKAFSEAYATLGETVQAVKTTVSAGTEARLRAEFNLPPLETLSTEPTHPQLQLELELELPIILDSPDPDHDSTKIEIEADSDSDLPLNLNASAEPTPSPTPYRSIHRLRIKTCRRLAHSTVASFNSQMPAATKRDRASAPPTRARKIEGHGTSNTRTLRHRALRRLHHLR